MWTKESPKEPGFYWIRSPLPLTDTMEFCIVNIWPGRENGPFAAYPGSDFRIPVSEVPSNVEWWPEPICPPGGLVHPLKQHEAQAWVVADLKEHLPGRTRADRIFTRLTDPLSLIEVGDLLNGLLGLATAYRLRIEAFRQAREKRKLAGMRIETTAPSAGYSKAEAQRAAGLRTQPKPGDPVYP